MTIKLYHIAFAMTIIIRRDGVMTITPLFRYTKTPSPQKERIMKKEQREDCREKGMVSGQQHFSFVCSPARAAAP